MKCPTCGSPDHRVHFTTEKDDRIQRTRACNTCGKRFRTVEAPVEVFDQAAQIREAFRQLGQAVQPEE